MWLLERTSDLRRPTRDVCRFMGALAVLSAGAIHVLFVRSLEPQSMLNRPSVRFDLERYAVTFASLDDAIKWADEKKYPWLTQGWTEIDMDAAHVSRERSDVAQP